jgi:hypothetical protein
MTDDTPPPGDPFAEGSDGGDGGDGGVGSVGEEAAKLFAALSGWAKDQGGEHAGAASVSDVLKDLNAHIATDDCRYCPLCRMIQLVRTTSPEVRSHLAVAASSMMQAAAALMASQVPQERGPVQKIDLDDESWDDQ